MYGYLASHPESPLLSIAPDDLDADADMSLLVAGDVQRVV